jgi:hypothetical protein
MPSPKDDAYILNIWRNLEKEYISSGLSRTGALKKIAKEYSVSVATAYFWLTPSYHAQQLKLSRTEHYKRQREWAKRNRARLSEYSKNYWKFRRNLSSYIQELFLEEDHMSSLSISEKLKEKIKIRFGKEIILNAIAKYNIANEDNPILEVKPDFYKFQENIY